jgi:hypothetical protein
MAKYDLSSAINYASQLPEIKYSNIGTISNDMVAAGFDPKIAKMALMLVFKENPQIKEHLKSAGVNALQAAKAMYEANVEMGQILDKLLEMGYLRDEAVDAIKSINLDEGDQEVNKFTEKPHEDNSYADYADPGYEYDDIPPEAVQELIDSAEEDKSNMNPETLRNILEKYDVSQNSISQLNKELFAKEAAAGSETDAVKDLIMGTGDALSPDVKAIMMGGMDGGSRPYDVLFAMITNHMIRNPQEFVQEVMHMAVEPYNQSVGDAHPQHMIQENMINWQEVWEWMIDHVQRYWASQKQKFEDVEPEFDEEGNQKQFMYMGADPEFYDRYYEEPWRFSSVKVSVDLAWRDIGLALQDSGVDKDQIITILQENGASDEEAHAAALPRDGEEPEEDEGPYGAPSDAPEDLDLGASGDFPYSAGMDVDGPGGLNDSLEGAPGPNDFSGTGGGYLGGPDDTADGDFFAESDSDGFFEDMAKEYVSKDPQMTRGDIVEILKNEGADKQEASEVADKLKLEDDPSIRPGVFVRSNVGVGKVSSVWETMYGKMANVVSEDGSEYEFLIDDIEVMQDHKASSTNDDLFVKITSHLDGEWFESLQNSKNRNTYSNRVKESRALLSEINNRLAITKNVGEVGMLIEARDALNNEILFCQASLSDNQFMGEQEYVNSLPRYEFAKEASLGSQVGPGGGESMVLIADEMEKKAASIDWEGVVITDSIAFVNNLSPAIVGNAQEVAKMAFNEFSQKVAFVEDVKRQDLISEFMKNVEDVRRRVVADVKTKTDDEDDEDKGKEDETTKNNYKKNKEEGEKLLEEKRKHERGEDIPWNASKPGLDMNNKRKVWKTTKTEEVQDISDEGWLL